MARRSARLSKSNQSQADVNKPLPTVPQLGSVLERDESPEDAENQESIDHVINKSQTQQHKQQLKKLSSIRTPKTEPRPSKSVMDPKTVHVSTVGLDSGQKLGFSDIPLQPRQSIGSVQNTPTRSDRKPLAQQTSFDLFKFASQYSLSDDAQKIMDNVREDAARIKAEMKAQRNLQEQKDGEAEKMFNPYGRRIAQPKSKAGRFSEVHMAQFKQMDSIANHPSSFRAKPGYAMPTTTQSLKRSPSKAGLDEPERPRTAGKGTPARKQPPSFSGRPTQINAYKPAAVEDRAQSSGPAKRLRRSEADDVSTSRPTEVQSAKPSAIPRSTSSLFSPTKASMAKTQSASPAKHSMLPRSQTAKGVREAARKSLGRTSAAMSKFTSKLLEAQQETRKNSSVMTRPASTTDLTSAAPVAKTPALPTTTAGSTSFSSRLPTFSGLKSILRSPHKTSADREGTPKRPNTAAGIPESAKKVDFTPSVKSRYAVKLANNSPSPAKLTIQTPERVSGAVIPYDPAAYVVDEDDDDNDNDNDDAWEDAESSSLLEYPSLPPLPSEPKVGPVNHTVQQKAKELTRDSEGFKSIFTTLHPRPSSTRPAVILPSAPANQVTKSPRNSSARQSRPSTIRRVRTSSSTTTIEPFADTEVHTMAHGLPAKKRRRESMYFDTHEKSTEASKENHPVPGAWDDGVRSEDEGIKPAKRAKTLDFKDIDTEGITNLVSPKKKSAAREAAARNARDRKSMIPGQAQGIAGNGVLSMSRLNMLSQPKRRV